MSLALPIELTVFVPVRAVTYAARKVRIKKDEGGCERQTGITDSLIVLGFIVSSMAAFLAELLESGIGAQRVPDWIEPKKGRRDGRWAIKPATVRRL